MRVSDRTNFNAIRDSVNRSKGKLDHSQNELSTMKKLNQPSDDPVGAVKVLQIRTDKVNNEQFQRNMRLAENFLNNTDNILEEIVEVLNRAKEIAISQSSGASSTDESRLGVSEEVNQLYQRAVSLANARIGDRYLFGGYRVDKPPVDDRGQYLGDDGEMMVEVAKDVYISTNLPGFELFNTNPANSHDARLLYGPQENPDAPQQQGAPQESRNVERTLATLEQEKTVVAPSGDENVNLFNELQALRISLLTGDLEGIRTTLDRFDQLNSSVVANRARVGSRLSGLQGTLRTLERQNLVNAELNQHIEDADMVEVMNNIAKEETIFRGVLSSSQKLVQPTLMDFLK